MNDRDEAVGPPHADTPDGASAPTFGCGGLAGILLGGLGLVMTLASLIAPLDDTLQELLVMAALPLMCIGGVASLFELWSWLRGRRTFPRAATGVLLALALGGWWTSERSTFSSVAWRHPSWLRPRSMMVDDLLTRVGVVGKSRAELEGLLGLPDCDHASSPGTSRNSTSTTSWSARSTPPGPCARPKW